MTMQEWIKQNFAEFQDGSIVVSDTEESTVTCSADWLATQLGTTVPPAYAFLITTPLYTTGGWNGIVDKWKETGIIN